MQITLPEEKQLAEGVHTLVHVDNEGESALVNGASVTADGAVFEAESFSVYVMASTGKTAGNYSNGETIYLHVGESITLKVDAETPNTYFKVYDGWDNGAGKAYLMPNIYQDSQVHTWGNDKNYTYYSTVKKEKNAAGEK